MVSESEKSQRHDTYDRTHKSCSSLRHDIFRDSIPRNVAIYFRFSSSTNNQKDLIELKKLQYMEMLEKRPHWNLVDYYFDECVSSTSLKYREAFSRMLYDCDTGKIDLIITKTVSKFSMNIAECIEVIRHLHSLKTPVGVFFENEDIYSLDRKSTFILNNTAASCQEEVCSTIKVGTRYYE